MTINQYQHHAEQMEAARREFAKLYAGLPPKFEMEVWQMFLKTKGLITQPLTLSTV